MNIAPLKQEIIDYLEKHNLTKKFIKQLNFLKIDFRHPSLHTEILEPKERGIRSFRINLDYRALFFFDPEEEKIKILVITKHYQ